MLNIIKILKNSWTFLILFALHTNQSHANTGVSGNKLFINISGNFSTILNSVIRKDSLPAKKDSLLTKKDSGQSNESLNAPISYSATDSISFQVDSQEVFLYKDAKISYEKTVLSAGFVRLNWGTNLVYAKSQTDTAGKETGRPEFDDSGQKFKSGTIKYNFKSKRGKITEVRTKEGEGFIHGNNVLKDQYDNLYIRQGLYTTCSLDTPHFQIAASKLKIIKNDKIVTGPAVLVIENITTPLFIPFGFFPNKKGQNSGILIPTVGESSSYGFSLENGGYYFALSEKANLALQGDIYSKGNYAIRSNSQYYNRYRYRGNLSLNYSVVKNSYVELPDYSEGSNFFVRWNHSQDPKSNPYSRFSATVNAGSRNYFRRTLNTSTTDYLTNTFQSNISYSRNWPGKPYNLSANLRHSQNTKTHDINLSLPEVAFTVNRQFPFKRKEKVGNDLWYEKIGISYSGNAQNTIATKDSLLFRTKTLSQFSNGIQHSIPISTSFNVMKYFTVSPSFNYSEKWYRQYSHHRWDGTKVVTDTVQGFKAAREFSASASMNTRLYGMYLFKKSKIQAIRHVMTPNIGYTYKPDFSKPLWGNYETVQSDATGRTAKYSIFDRGIYGGPSQGTQSSVSYGLDNNLEMKVRQVTDTGVISKKIQIFQSLSFNSAYNFAADSIKMQPINITGRSRLFDKIDVVLNSSFSPYSQNSQGQIYNKYYFEEKGKLARFTNGGLAINTSLNPDAFKKVKKKVSNNLENPESPANKQTEEELKYIQQHPEEYVDFNIPWNLSMGYNVQLSKIPGRVHTDSTAISQTLSFNGDFSLTPQWKVTFSSGYDFKAKDFTYTNIGIYRDLHCWEMRFNWIPFGFRQSFNFQINVKSTVLQDLKLTRRNPPAISR